MCPDGVRHVWRVRGTDDSTGVFLEGYDYPTSCPRCKRRFDTGWESEEKIRFEKKEFASYRDWVRWRNAQKKRKKKEDKGKSYLNQSSL